MTPTPDFTGLADRIERASEEGAWTHSPWTEGVMTNTLAALRHAADLERDRDHWKANHDEQVRRKQGTTAFLAIARSHARRLRSDIADLKREADELESMNSALWERLRKANAVCHAVDAVPYLNLLDDEQRVSKAMAEWRAWPPARLAAVDQPGAET